MRGRTRKYLRLTAATQRLRRRCATASRRFRVNLNACLSSYGAEDAAEGAARLRRTVSANVLWFRGAWHSFGLAKALCGINWRAHRDEKPPCYLSYSPLLPPSFSLSI